MPTKHVFISYKSEDHEFAFDVNQQVKEAGFETWIDKEWLRAGEDWREEIDQGIQDSFAIILIMSPRAAQSKYIIYEFAYAWAMGVKVIPIMCDHIDLREFHPRLEGRQYEDFQNGNRPWGKLFRRLTEIYELFANADPPLSVKAAVKTLDSHDSHEREQAIETLSRMEHPSALGALTNALSHPLWDVRARAAWKLGAKHDASATRNLISALSDSNSTVRAHAAGALGDLGDAAAVPELIKLLPDSSEFTDLLNRVYESDSVAGVTANALLKLNTPEALEAVERWRNNAD